MFQEQKLSLNDVLSSIQQADEAEINEIIQAVIRRYRIACPDWEIMFLSLPKKDPELRRKTVEGICTLLNRDNQ